MALRKHILRSLFEGLIACAAGIALVLLGASIPVHFRAVSPAVVAAAGNGTEQVEDLADSLLDRGRIGSLGRVWSADEDLPRSDGERYRVRQVVERFPLYTITGGPAPYLETFLESIRFTPPEQIETHPFLPVLLPRDHRRALLGFLERSVNGSVLALLEARTFTGWTRLMPVNSPAGHPLDAALLTLALLAQEGALPNELTRELREPIDAVAFSGDHGAMRTLEEALLATLSLGKRLDWTQLSDLAGSCDSLDDWVSFAALIRQQEARIDLAFTASLLTDPGSVARYVAEHGDDGWRALEQALPDGAGAIEYLFDKNKTLYQPPGAVALLKDRLGTPLIELTTRSEGIALNAKFLAFLIGGYALSLSLSSLGDLIRGRNTLSRLHPLIITGNLFIALFLTAAAWVILEPALLRSGANPQAPLKLDFNLPNALGSLQSQNISTAMIDQITIITLIIFFFLQLMVYIFCLVKLAELRRRPGAPVLKLQLLENEDNLFELGLYVGLAGTVFSLILLAMDIVQASLIAAYASTLFGIIFVALLKVCHVRPYRRALIEAADGPASTVHSASPPQSV